MQDVFKRSLNYTQIQCDLHQQKNGVNELILHKIIFFNKKIDISLDLINCIILLTCHPKIFVKYFFFKLEIIFKLFT